MQDQHCIIVADVSNPHQHARPRVLRPGPGASPQGPEVWVVKRSTARALNLVVSTQQEGQTRLQDCVQEINRCKEISESGGIQAPGACGPGLQGAWGPGPQGLGPGPPGAWGLFPTKTTQTSQITIFRKPPGGSLAKAWVSAETAASEVGTWRETKPGYPPYPPPPPPFASNTPPKVGGPPTLSPKP